MALTTLHVPLFMLLTTLCSLRTQELVRLNVSPQITAECGKQVILNCNVSSSRNGLSIKRMQWFLNEKILCSVDSEGKISPHHRHTPSAFDCEYNHGQLSLIFQNMQPLETGTSNSYMCKLHSNQAVAHKSTTVELQECCGIVENKLTSDGHICTFKHVYPDGNVHWFHGSHNLSAEAPHNTTKQVDKDGWLTIRSYLERKCSDEPYNCSLTSTRSGRSIACTLVQNFQCPDGPKPEAPTHRVWNGAGSQGPMRTFLCILILVAVTLK